MFSIVEFHFSLVWLERRNQKKKFLPGNRREREGGRERNRIELSNQTHKNVLCLFFNCSVKEEKDFELFSQQKMSRERKTTNNSLIK